ncbi:MAG TPA: TonB-dependent receptor [Myxococcota bacterium]|nr:TonB-dependent receptor [Myxococcota bacterium]
MPLIRFALATGALALLPLGGGVRADDAAPAPPAVEREVPGVVARGVTPHELPDDPTAFTTVIRTDAYAGEGKTAEQLLSEAVGVQVRRLGGPGQPAEISIRGSTARQVIVLLDGVQLNDAQSGTVDLSTIPADLLDRIEISRGGGSLQAGSGAIGGVVNLVTKRPGAEPLTRAAVEGGSFGTFQGSLTHSRRAGGVELTAGYDGFGTKGDYEFQRVQERVLGQTIAFSPKQLERINDEAESHASLLRVGRELGEHLHASFQNSAYYDSRGVPGLDSGNGPTGGQSEDAHERKTADVAAAVLDASDVAGADGALRVYDRFQRIHFTDPSSTCGALDSENENYALGTRGEVSREWQLGPSLHRLSAIGDVHEDRLTSTEFENRHRLASDWALQDELSVLERRVILAPALRYDLTEGFDGEWLPRIGAIVKPLPWLRIKGNAERSYRAPSFDELFFPDQCFLRGNPNLRPERARNFDAGVEAGFEHVFFLDDVRLGGDWFRQAIDDSIVFLLVSPNTVAAENTGPATVNGFELHASTRLLGWITLAANSTLFHAELDATGTPLPGRAEHETNVRLEIGPPSGLAKLVGTLQHTGDIPVTDTGLTKIPARTVFDASLTVDAKQLPWLGPRVPAQRLLVSLMGRNLTDRSVRDALFFPQPGRTVAIRAEAWF